MAEMNEEERLDMLALENLARDSDVRLPHVLWYYLYMPTIEDAEKCAGDLRAIGYNVTVREQSKDALNWLALAKHKAVPTIEEIRRQGVVLNRIARAAHGVYDGWEAENI